VVHVQQVSSDIPHTTASLKAAWFFHFLSKL